MYLAHEPTFTTIFNPFLQQKSQLTQVNLIKELSLREVDSVMQCVPLLQLSRTTALSVLFGCKWFREFVYRYLFEVENDHKSPLSIFKKVTY